MLHAKRSALMRGVQGNSGLRLLVLLGTVPSSLVRGYLLTVRSHLAPVTRNVCTPLQSINLSSTKLYASMYLPPDFTIVGGEDESTGGPNDKKTFTESRLNDDPVNDSWYDDDDQSESSLPRRRGAVRSGRAVKSAAGSSWMSRNDAFTDRDSNSRGDLSRERGRRDGNRNRRGEDGGDRARTFRQDFRGTRVFVQGLPPHASWQDVKDHFRIAGTVVFASVSSDMRTGESKCCGIVQFETTEMALTAIAIMRNHPMDGHNLFVREDVQESKDGAQFANRMPQNKKGPTPPTKWRCADEGNADHLSDDEIKSIRSLIKARDDARRRRQYDVSDNIREELKLEYNVHLDDRLKMWWVSFDGSGVPQSVRDAKGDGRWGTPQTWRQIPTTPENDACVNPDLVNALLTQRDIARKEKDFSTADALLDEARNSPDGDLYLRIHDESRTWRIWTDEPPPRPFQEESPVRQTPAEECLAIVQEFAPERTGEIQMLLEKFQGREYQILKKLKSRYVE